MTAVGLAISSRDRRALTLGVVVVGGGWSVALGLPRLKSWEATQRAEAASAAHERNVADAGARSLRAMHDSLASRRSRLAQLDSSIVSAISAAEAGAQLSSFVADAAETSGVRVTSLQIRGDTVATAGFARVAVRFVAQADVAALAALLRELEDGAILAAVREIVVSQPEPAAPSDRAEVLRIELVAETLARIRQAPAVSRPPR